MPSLPDVRQGKTFDCGEAVVRVVCDLWGVHPRLMPLATPQDGTHPATLVAVLRGAGLRCMSGEGTPEMLRSFAKLGLPAICLVQEEGEGHYVVVGDVVRNKVHFQCPLKGPREQKLVDFDARWHDVDGWGTQYRRFVLVAFP